MSNKIIKYIKKNTKKNLSDLEINDYLDKPRTWYFGLSINEFLKINPEDNEKIVLKNLKESYFLENIIFEELVKPKVNLKVGEIYYDSMAGLCVITQLFEADESKRGFNGCEIGRYERLRIPGRSFVLHDNSRVKFRLATDKDIVEYLIEELNMFNLGNSDNGDSCVLTINEDSLYISGEEFIYLNKEQALKLKALLNREIN